MTSAPPKKNENTPILSTFSSYVKGGGDVESQNNNNNKTAGFFTFSWYSGNKDEGCCPSLS